MQDYKKSRTANVNLTRHVHIDGASIGLKVSIDFYKFNPASFVLNVQTINDVLIALYFANART